MPQPTFSVALSGNSTGYESPTDSFSAESFNQSATQEFSPPPRNEGLKLDGVVLQEATLVNSPILPHVCMVASLIEGRTVSRDELIVALRKSMRQRCMGRSPRREYVLRYLNQHPP